MTSSDELLERLVAAAQAWEDPNERFRVTSLEMRLGPDIRHPGLTRVGEERGWIRAPKRDLDELRERKLIRVDVQRRRAGKPTSTTVEQWHFDITDAGYQHVEALARARNAAPAGDDLRETWSWRELPILRAALRRLDAGAGLADLEDIRAELGLTGDNVWAGVHALQESTPPYVTASYTMGWRQDHASGSISAVSERARRELGTWPSADQLVTELAAALEEASEQAEPEQKTRLSVAADALSGFARDVAVAVVARHVGG
jgi:hypothetical protein